MYDDHDCYLLRPLQAHEIDQEEAVVRELHRRVTTASPRTPLTIRWLANQQGRVYLAKLNDGEPILHAEAFAWFFIGMLFSGLLFSVVFALVSLSTRSWAPLAMAVGMIAALLVLSWRTGRRARAKVSS